MHYAKKEQEIMTQQEQPAKKLCYLGHDEALVLGVGPQLGDDDAALCGPCAESWTAFADEYEPRSQGGRLECFAEWMRTTTSVPLDISVREAVLGQWYIMPSGEIEKACAHRGERGREQVGFLHMGGNPNDSDDVRWLPGDVEVTPASAQEVQSWAGYMAESARSLAHLPAAQAIQTSAALVPAEVVVKSVGAALDDLFSRVESTSNKLSPLFSSESGEWQTDPGTFAWLNGWAQSRWGSGFVLDVCASKENALCAAYFTKEASCLAPPVWFGPWFMNPPYGDPEHPCRTPHERCRKKTCEKRGAHADVYVPGVGDFVSAARRQAQEGRPGMCLLPFRPDTEWWRQCVLAPDGEQVAVGGDWIQGWSWVRWSSGLLVEVRLISGRLSFVRPGGGESWTAPFPSVVVVFDRWK